MTVTVTPAGTGTVRITATTAAQPVRVTPTPAATPAVRQIIAGPRGESGLNAEAPVDLAGWYQLAKEL